MRRFWLLIVLMFGVSASAQTTLPSQHGDLRVMSFNIRLDTKSDKENQWPHRRELWVSTVKAFDPDLLGLQEVLPGQAKDIRAALGDYEMIGRGRNAGGDGEASSLLFRRSRFERVNDGVFWLSPTPDTPGSKGWDAQLPRVCTWAELKDRDADAKHARLFYFNTHWDHIGDEARQQSASLMRKRIVEIAGDAPVIVTGDFNCSDVSKGHHLFTGPRDDDAGKVTLIYSYREVHPKREPTDSSFHGFTGRKDKGAMIDWICHTADFAATACEIDRTNDHGRYPSDHYAIVAVLKPTVR